MRITLRGAILGSSILLGGCLASPPERVDPKALGVAQGADSQGRERYRAILRGEDSQPAEAEAFLEVFEEEIRVAVVISGREHQEPVLMARMTKSDVVLLSATLEKVTTAGEAEGRLYEQTVVPEDLEALREDLSEGLVALETTVGEESLAGLIEPVGRPAPPSPD